MFLLLVRCHKEPQITQSGRFKEVEVCEAGSLGVSTFCPWQGRTLPGLILAQDEIALFGFFGCLQKLHMLDCDIDGLCPFSGFFDAFRSISGRYTCIV